MQIKCGLLTAFLTACTTTSNGAGPDALRDGVQLTSLSTTEGPLAGGTIVTLSGARFADGSGTLAVSFGDKSAVVGTFDDHSAVVTVPAGVVDGVVDVSVSNSLGNATLSGSFTYRCQANHVGIASQCVDFATDNNHCGRADNACSAETTCLGGACTVPAPMPTARTARGAVRSADGKIYVIGGQALVPQGDLIVSVDTVEVYDPRTNVWTTKAAAPFKAIARAVAVGDKVYAIASGSAAFAYDIATDTWTSRAVPPPAARRTLVGVALAQDGRILVLGGSLSSGPTDALALAYAYDPTANTWTDLPSMPHPHENFGAATSLDGRVYAFGGRGAGSEVDAFNIASNSWSTVAPMPASMISGSSAATGLDGKIYVVGSSGSFQVYNAATNTWTVGPSLATSSGVGAGVVTGTDGRVYVMGGFQQGPTPRFRRVLQVYDPKRGIWIAGPP